MHVADDHDSDPHVYDDTLGEVVEALLTNAEAQGRTAELIADPSSDRRVPDMNDLDDALAGFADSNRALFAEYVNGWYPPERAAAIIASAGK